MDIKEQSREEIIQDLKIAIEKDQGREATMEEVMKVYNNMEKMADIFFEMWMRDRRKKKESEELIKE
jgi:hypothetical protein